MKLVIRYFSIGLLTATIILFTMYMITDDSSQAVGELTVEQLSSALEEKGYRTISQDEFISYSIYLDELKAEEEASEKNNAETNKKKEKTETEQNNEKENGKKTDQQKEKDNEKEKKDKKPKSVTITVEQGFVSQDIGNILKDEEIIDDVDEFVKYMEKNDYSPFIQIGKFKVNKDMSLKDLGETLTTFPGN